MTEYAHGMQALLDAMNATYLTLLAGVAVAYYAYRTLAKVIKWSKLFILGLSLALSAVLAGLSWGLYTLL